jgi:tRNA/rRNA methyltransferase
VHEKPRIPTPVVVFVRPKAAGNIGALARVMSNFGCADLRLVGEPREGGMDSEFSKVDWALACRGQAALENARWYPTLAAALENVQIAIGTSGRDQEFPRGYARPGVGPEDAFATLARWEAASGPLAWALVIGPEDHGLSQEESALCQKLVRLSTVDESPSMNAAMAAGAFLYHWHLVNEGLATLGKREDTGAFVRTEDFRSEWASVEQKEQFLDKLMELLSHTSFLKYPDVDGIRARIRRWLQTAPVPLLELLYAFEMVYQVKSWGTGKFEARDFLKKKNTPDH